MPSMLKSLDKSYIPVSAYYKKPENTPDIFWTVLFQIKQVKKGGPLQATKN